jgi:hypothetical protein
MLRRTFASAAFAAAIAACSGAADTAFFGGGSAPGAPNGPGPDGGQIGPDGGPAPGSDGDTVGPDGAPVVDAGPSDANELLDASCGTRKSAARPPAYLYIVLDGSGSMLDLNKWTSARAALDQVFDELFTEQDKNLGVGLMVFSDQNDATQGQGPYPTTVDVGVAFVDQKQHDALRARIDSSGPSAGTPTLTVLQGAYAFMAKLAPPAPLPANGRKVVALVTDGVPNGGATEEAQCTTLAGQQLSAGITTFAVGVGPFPSSDPNTYNPAFLGALANAGGAAPAGCNPNEASNPQNLCFFQVTPGADTTKTTQAFVSAINDIRRSIASCELGIDGKVDPAKFNVIITDGAGAEHVVPEGGANGWTFDNDPPTKVTLHGASCETLRLDHKAAASFLLGCDTYKN